jgi:hypothetical protein
MSDILRLTLPLTVWLASFSAVYGLHGFVCSARWIEVGLSPETGRWALVLAAGSAATLQVALVFAIRSHRLAAVSGWVQRTSLSLSLVALVATVWTLLPTTATTTCL